ncbi:IS1634 family transposase [Alicyclobacillus tolerans]|uniref:IS1634 family transposase n=1 Tax=Alicyclobacillus tolerans TaxID=90970 RepID=UPI001F01930D|nr:IS1634 family transposase [Alicyclobacillus tolerans]MCF8568609.1 IS1634 family transposase [Alicyclobacillus tolerans]
MIADMLHFVMGASAVWAKLIDRFDWVQIIDDAAWRDDCKLSVGTRVKALLINIGTDRKALYKVQEFYEKRDTEVLLGEGVSASDLNDDALGRALDILYDLDMDKLYPRLALHTAQQLRVLDQYDDLLPFHSDTTSISLTGDYACQDVVREDVKGDDFRIARGYSKDHRPELKQIIFGLSTLGGLPICANVDKGNQDDHTWNFENIPRLLQQIDKSIREKSIYIADSAVVTKDNLALLASEKAHFISRFPSTYTLCDTLKQSAWAEDTWVNVGRMGTAKDSASYKIRAFSREFYGKPYRFIVVRSTSLDTRKEHKLQDVLEREEKSLRKAADKASRMVYSCLEDANTAAESFVKAHSSKHKPILHSLHMDVVTENVQVKRERRGRPKKDDPVPGVRTQYRLAVEIIPPSNEALQTWREREATFVLITDVRDDQRIPDEQILRLYKEQHEVEARFRFLKSPYHVGPIFLQNPHRVKAFAYVMLMSLLLYSAFEYLIRQQMANETEPLILPGKRKSFRPTGASVLEMLDEVTTFQIRTGETSQRMTARLHDDQVERVLNLLNLDLSIYTEVQKSA